jgi:subtilisin family serine protease
MRFYGKWGVCLLAAAVVAGAVPVAAATPAAPLTLAAAAGHGGFRDITLVTGDRLSVATDGSNQVAVRPAKGREKVGFVQRTVAGHVKVIPADAVRLVDLGRLDERLFDVTTLLEYGYDDAKRPDLPLIVTSAGGTGMRASAFAGATGTRELSAVDGAAVTVSRREAGTFWSGLVSDRPGVQSMRADVGKIWLDGKRRPTLDVSVPQIGAPGAWQAGYTGKGVPVAVLDTGIDDTHPDLAGRVTAKRNFTGDGPVVDDVGHGTHVASTIAGTGAASGGRYKGVAPDVALYDGKVCANEGCPESAILAAMQWAAGEQHAKVVNMSLGGPDGEGIDPLEQAVGNLTARYGTLFVVAAGNDGPGNSTLASPGTADDALTVGAVDKSDNTAPFSSRGPRLGDDALKPDITAPGVGIVAARSKDNTLPVPPTGPDGRYSQMDGTSMATPHVAGAAAILAQEHPDWKPAQLKAALMGSAKPNPMAGGYTQGAGRVDLTRAIRQPVTVAPASVSFGRQLWPHNDDQPVKRTLTYHNTGTTPLTFALTATGTGPDGKAAPAGLFTLSTPTVTVPAGGDASVEVTADTRVDMPDGYATGAVVATAGDVVVRTPLAVNREAESYDLTINTLDRTGKAIDTGVDVLRLDKPGTPPASGSGGTVKLRLPKGRYAVSTLIRGSDGDRTMLVQPLLILDKAQTATMDARIGKPVSVTVPRADAKASLAFLGFTVGPVDNVTGIGAIGESFDGVYSGQIGRTNPTDTFVSEVHGQWGEPHNSPYLYSLAWYDKGRFPTGVQRTVAARDLATVQADLGSAVPGARADRQIHNALTGRDTGSVSSIFSYDLAGVATEYYNTDTGVRWSSKLTEVAPGTGPENPDRPVSETVAPPTAYQSGRTYRQAWNRAVFGPSVAGADPRIGWAARLGDETLFAVPIFADSAGRPGYSVTDSARLMVYRDGNKIVETPTPSGQFVLPAADGGYTVTAEVTRGAPFALATRVNAAWTFRSGHVDGTTPKVLPLMTVRFTPALDPTNSAPADCLFAIPVTVDRQGDAGSAKDLAVQASFDDGATWQPLRVVGDRVQVIHPKGHGYVSLKATAADGNGNRVEETVIRAYRF